MKNPNKYNLTNTVSLFTAAILNIVGYEVKADDLAQRVTSARLWVIDLYNIAVQTLVVITIAVRSAIATALYNVANWIAPKAIPIARVDVATVYVSPTPTFEWSAIVEPTPVPALILTFNHNVASELQERIEVYPTITPPVTVETPLEALQREETPIASIYGIPHARKERLSKGKVKRDYRAVHPSKVEPGALYWYKDGRRWVEMIAPDHAAPVAA